MPIHCLILHSFIETYSQTCNVTVVLACDLGVWRSDTKPGCEYEAMSVNLNLSNTSSLEENMTFNFQWQWYKKTDRYYAYFEFLQAILYFTFVFHNIHHFRCLRTLRRFIFVNVRKNDHNKSHYKVQISSFILESWHGAHNNRACGLVIIYKC